MFWYSYTTVMLILNLNKYFMLYIFFDTLYVLIDRCYACVSVIKSFHVNGYVPVSYYLCIYFFLKKNSFSLARIHVLIISFFFYFSYIRICKCYWKFLSNSSKVTLSGIDLQISLIYFIKLNNSSWCTSIFWISIIVTNRILLFSFRFRY